MTVPAPVDTIKSGKQVSYLYTGCSFFKSSWLSCFTSTETVGLLGAGAQGGHLDFHTAAEFCSFFAQNGPFSVD